MSANGMSWLILDSTGRFTVQKFNGETAWSSNAEIVPVRGGVPPFSVHLAPSPPAESECVTKTNSRLQLVDGRNKTVLQTRRFFGEAPFKVVFLNTGSLIVKDSTQKICWESGAESRAYILVSTARLGVNILATNEIVHQGAFNVHVGGSGWL